MTLCPAHRLIIQVALLATASGSAFAGTLEVGPGRRFSRIEEANARAKPGDTILVHPLPNNAPYENVAVFVRHADLNFRAVPAKDQKWVTLSGKGFDFSGRGSIPRAIFQFNKGADNCVLDGFELTEAHNKSHNGAGVRINQANNTTVHNCNIHSNDMGIMSNGDGTLDAGVNQLISNCIIHHNGSHEEPGYNHNLYLGGTSATLKFCDIHHSLTGHNVKSRAHFTRVLYCYVHDSSNREFDLVDAKDTERKNSHAVLMGNIIVKDSQCKGNRGVVHFGQDGGREHNGTLLLIHNTIVTPYITPVLVLSAEQAKAVMIGNFVCDGGTKQSGQHVAGGYKRGDAANASGSGNRFDRGFADPGLTSLSVRENSFGKHLSAPFRDPAKHDYRPKGTIAPGLHIPTITLPPYPGDQRKAEAPLLWEYVHPADSKRRNPGRTPQAGAHE